MRIAVMVIGLILGALMFLQTFLVAALSSSGSASDTAGAIGLFMALLWLIACAIVLPVPFASTVLFVVAGGVGFGFSGDFPDLALWAVASFVLAMLAFFGWIEKRRTAGREKRRAAEDAMARQADVDRAVAAGITAHQRTVTTSD